jgi:hypothetical protein
MKRLERIGLVDDICIRIHHDKKDTIVFKYTKKLFVILKFHQFIPLLVQTRSLKGTGPLNGTGPLMTGTVYS